MMGLGVALEVKQSSISFPTMTFERFFACVAALVSLQLRRSRKSLITVWIWTSDPLFNFTLVFVFFLGRQVHFSALTATESTSVSLKMADEKCSLAGLVKLLTTICKRSRSKPVILVWVEMDWVHNVTLPLCPSNVGKMFKKSFLRAVRCSDSFSDMVAQEICKILRSVSQIGFSENLQRSTCDNILLWFRILF